VRGGSKIVEQEEAHVWKENKPGDSPVCIVGAGFQLAVLDPTRPSTDDIISNTVDNCGDQFPALKRLTPLLANRNLNYVWTNIERICQYGPTITPSVIGAYEGDFNGKPTGFLVDHLKKLDAASSPSWLLWILLGVELKKMLALQYDRTNIKLKVPIPCGLKTFLAEIESKSVTWISLNYDLCLETILRDQFGDGKWSYAFEDFFKGFDKGRRDVEGHVIVKPHGSLNIWFKTVWKSRSISKERDLHKLYFVDSKCKLKTCRFGEVGCVNGNDPAAELRPWLIGYLPDEMKDELNSPGNFADSAHDLCKWNLTSAALALQRASSLYILAYSMPEEDRWIWERLRALPNKKFPIYVVSRNDTKRIVESLGVYGFDAKELSDNGCI